jgi:hypothetical protein
MWATYENKHIVYNLYDLDRVPVLAREMGVDSYETVVVENGERRLTGGGSDEMTITNLIIRATRDEEKWIYFLEGHGERSIRDEGRGGYSVAAEKLMETGFMVESFSLLATKQVPVGADVVVVTSPVTAFSENEGETLAAWAKDGGRLMVLADDSDAANSLLPRLGLVVVEGALLDPINLGGDDLSVPLVSSYTDSPVTAGFGLSTVYPGAFALGKGGTGKKGTEYLKFARTSERSWIDTDRDGKMGSDEKYGPHTVGVMLQHKGTMASMVAFGDADFASNAFFNVAGNGNLFLNAVNWLADQSGLVSIIPGKAQFLPMYVTKEQSRIVFIAAVVFMPLVIVIAGIATWVLRRRL